MGTKHFTRNSLELLVEWTSSVRYADSNKWLAVGYARETEDFSSLSSSSPLRSARLAREYETIAPFVISESETAKSRWKQKKKEKKKKLLTFPCRWKSTPLSNNRCFSIVALWGERLTLTSPLCCFVILRFSRKFSVANSGEKSFSRFR